MSPKKIIQNRVSKCDGLVDDVGWYTTTTSQNLQVGLVSRQQHSMDNEWCKQAVKCGINFPQVSAYTYRVIVVANGRWK